MNKRSAETKPGDEITMSIEKKRNALQELWGALAFKKPTKQLIGETRKEIESKWEE